LLLVSDLHSLYSEPSTTDKTRDKSVRKKLEFYYVLSRSITRIDWTMLEGLVKTRLSELEEDENEEQGEEGRDEDEGGKALVLPSDQGIAGSSSSKAVLPEKIPRIIEL
jgi:hypothetical protein